MAKKTAVVTEEVLEQPAVVATTVAPAQHGKKKSLSTTAFLVLTYLCLQQKPLAGKELTADEKEFLDSFNLPVTEAIADELIGMGVAKEENGELFITRFGILWVLKSTTFGEQFAKMYNDLSFDAMLKAFFDAVNNLKGRDQLKNKIKVEGRDGKPSQLHAGLLNAAETIAAWCE